MAISSTKSGSGSGNGSGGSGDSVSRSLGPSGTPGSPNFNPGQGAKNAVFDFGSPGHPDVHSATVDPTGRVIAGGPAQPQVTPQGMSMQDAVNAERARLLNIYGSGAASSISDRNIQEKLYGTTPAPAPPDTYPGYNGPRPGTGDPLGLRATMQADPGYVNRNLAPGGVNYPTAFGGGRGPVKLQEAMNEGYTGYMKTPYGGAMGGEIIPGENATKYGAEKLFQRIEQERQRQSGAGASLIGQAVFQRPTMTTTYTVGGKTYTSQDQAIDAYVAANKNQMEAATIGNQTNANGLAHMSLFGELGQPLSAPAYSASFSSVVTDEAQRQAGIVHIPNMEKVWADMNNTLDKSLNPKINGLGEGIILKVPQGVSLPYESSGPLGSQAMLYEDTSKNQESIVKSGWQGEYVQAAYGGASMGAVIGAPGALPGFIVGGALGALGGVTYQFVSDTVKPAYSGIVESISSQVPKEYKEFTEAMMTPGMPGINIGSYYLLKEADKQMSQLTGGKYFQKTSEIPGELAGQAAGLIVAAGITAPLERFMPLAKESATELRYREVNLGAGVKIGGGDMWRGLVFEKGDQAKPIIGLANGKLTGYGMTPDIELTFQRLGVELKGASNVGELGQRVGKKMPNPYEMRELTLPSSSPANEEAYLGNIRQLMRDTKTQSVPPQFQKELMFKDVEHVPSEYAPRLEELIRKERSYLIFGGGARESQVLTPKTTSDVDIFLRVDKANDKANYYLKELQKIKGPPLRVSEESPGLLEVKTKEGWRHMLDIHDTTTTDIQMGDSEFFRWGNRIRHPDIKIGGKVFRQLREEGLAVGEGAAIPKGVKEVRNPTEVKFFDKIADKYFNAKGVTEPAAHRIKDVSNFARIQKSLLTYGTGTSKTTAQDIEAYTAFKKAADIKFTGVKDTTGKTYAGVEDYVAKETKKNGWYEASPRMMSKISPKVSKASFGFSLKVSSPSKAKRTNYDETRSLRWGSTSKGSQTSPSGSSSISYLKISGSYTRSLSRSYDLSSGSPSLSKIINSISLSPNKSPSTSPSPSFRLSPSPSPSPSSSPSQSPNPNNFRYPRTGGGPELGGGAGDRIMRIVGDRYTIKNPFKKGKDFTKDLLKGDKRWNI